MRGVLVVVLLLLLLSTKRTLVSSGFRGIGIDVLLLITTEHIRSDSAAYSTKGAVACLVS
jgi:hypothetical protein